MLKVKVGDVQGLKDLISVCIATSLIVKLKRTLFLYSNKLASKQFEQCSLLTIEDCNQMEIYNFCSPFRHLGILNTAVVLSEQETAHKFNHPRFS